MKARIELCHLGKEHTVINTESSCLRVIGKGFEGHVAVCGSRLDIFILSPEKISRIIKRNDGSDDINIGLSPEPGDIVLWQQEGK